MSDVWERGDWRVSLGGALGIVTPVPIALRSAAMNGFLF